MTAADVGPHIYLLYELFIALFYSLLTFHCIVFVQVNWMPFGRDIDLQDRYRLSLYRGCLQWLGEYEPHMPDRVVRQYGRVQGWPLDIIRAKDSRRKAELSGKKCYWTEYWERDLCWPDRHQRLYLPIEDLPSTSADHP